MGYLDVADVRKLEDLIIGAFYEDVMKGKMDQKRKQLEVEYTMGRDLRPGQRSSVISILHEWYGFHLIFNQGPLANVTKWGWSVYDWCLVLFGRSQNTDTILASLDQKLQSIHETAAEEKRQREQYDREIERLKKEIKSSGAMDVEEDGARGKGRRTNSGLYDDGETLNYYDHRLQPYQSKEYLEESYRAARTRKR